MHFNSIKVRLEHEHIFLKSFPFTKFQFHKGAIRTSLLRFENFNFALFQFHKGAIRTLLEPVYGLPELPFQFHKGAIRTERATTIVLTTLISIP